MNRSTFLKYVGLAGFSGSLIPGSFQQLGWVHHDENVLIKPKRLQKGDTIGLISPASIIPESDRYDEIVTTIEKLGFNVKVGENARIQYGYLAGLDKERAEDLNAMFRDPEVDAIIPFRGGWGSNRILEHIDFELIREHPKPLIGFSDITSLLLSIYASTGLITFHGPVGKSEWTPFTYRNFSAAVMKSESFSLLNPGKEPSLTIRSGTAKGPVLGGNLTVLTSMLGSGYLPSFKDAILFLEDVGEDVYRIDRMLTQLKLSGILNQINGLYFGKCTECLPGNDYSLSFNEVLNDHILPLDIPACQGAMIGHIDDMFTLPVGLPATLNADKGKLTFTEAAVV